MKKGDKIKMLIESTGEVRFYLVVQVLGNQMTLRIITEKEAGENPKTVIVKNLHTQERP